MGPHIAFGASDITSILREKEIVTPSYEPFAGYRCAMVRINGTLIELVETSLPEEKIWHNEATLKNGVLYDDQESKLSPREEQRLSFVPTPGKTIAFLPILALSYIGYKTQKALPRHQCEEEFFIVILFQRGHCIFDILS